MALFRTLAILLIVTAVGDLVVHRVAPATAVNAPTTTVGAPIDPASHETDFYLDIGASSSLGVQPISSRAQGYSNDVVGLEAARGVALSLKEVGCPGETADSILLRGAKSRIELMQGRCYHGGPAQLAQASGYLQSHLAQPGLVTIDIGFNDVRTCLITTLVNQTCFAKNLVEVKQDLPVLLAKLKGVAGPRAHFVGLEYSDPFLQHYLNNGATGRAQAALSLRDINALNQVLAGIYRQNHVAIANVPLKFATNNATLVTFKPYGRIPVNVKEVCRFTWMCTPDHDDHSNSLGYQQVAAAIVAVLPRNL